MPVCIPALPDAAFPPSIKCHEMRHTPFRGRRRLRLLRTRAVRRLRQVLRDATHGLLRRLRRRPHVRRPGDGIDFAEEPAKRASQRALLLSLRRIVGGRRSRRLFLFAVTVPDLVLRRMQPRFHRIRNLVWPDCPKSQIVNKQNFQPRIHFNAKTPRGKGAKS